MNALATASAAFVPIRHIDIRADPFKVFVARCEARALLWQACEFNLHEAVDVLQRTAIDTGLIAELGQDHTQQIMVDAFARVRP